MIWISLLTFSCTEYVAKKVEKEELTPVEPPEDDFDPFGEAPEWEVCQQGYYGRYYNLVYNHEDVEPEDEIYPQTDPERLDWWNDEYMSKEKFDFTLDFGTNWWPVDEGFEDDPSYFSGRWTAWLRVFENADLTFEVGASDDLWIYIDNEVKYLQPGINDFDSHLITIPMESGQYPIEIFYAHRSGNSGLRFFLISEEAAICPPDF